MFHTIPQSANKRIKKRRKNKNKIFLVDAIRHHIHINYKTVVGSVHLSMSMCVNLKKQIKLQFRVFLLIFSCSMQKKATRKHSWQMEIVLNDSIRCRENINGENIKQMKRRTKWKRWENSKNREIEIKWNRCTNLIIC